MMNRCTLSRCFIVVTMLAGANSLLAAEAGSVLFARGDVTAERQPAVALAKGDAVLDNDTIATGDASRAQLLLNDGAKIALRPNSRLRIDEYVFAGATDASGDVITTSGDRSVSTLIKGGFRTITGAIGKDDREAYEVRTAVGVLGIRGTDYSAVFCNADCDWVPGYNPNAPIEDGLYLGVTDGAILFRNEVADLELQAGQYAFIPLADRTPGRVDAPPPVLLDDNDLRFDANEQAAQEARDASGEGTLSGFDARLGTRRAPQQGAPEGRDGEPAQEFSAPEQPINAIDADGQTIDLTPGNQPRPPQNRTIGYSSDALGGTAIFSGAADNAPAQYRLDTANDLLGFAGPYPSPTGPATAVLDIGSATTAESGFDSITVLRWGRWSGGIVSADLGTGQVDTIDLSSRSLHWVSGPESAAPPVMPVTGSAAYTLIGNTSPTDSLGNVGVLGDASFFADFTNMRVDSTLSVDINATNWTASGTGSIGAQSGLPAHLFSGSYSVTAGGSTGGAGVFSGFFSAPGDGSDPSLPGGVGLNYSLQDMTGTTSVSGAAVFGNP